MCCASQKAPSNGAENGDLSNELVDKLMFQFSDVVRCVAKNVDLEYAKRNHLMTDTAISGGDSGHHQERELVQWKPDHSDKMMNSLENYDLVNLYPLLFAIYS